MYVTQRYCLQLKHLHYDPIDIHKLSHFQKALLLLQPHDDEDKLHHHFLYYPFYYYFHDIEHERNGHYNPGFHFHYYHTHILHKELHRVQALYGYP